MNKILKGINLVFRTSVFGYAVDFDYNRIGIYYPIRRFSGWQYEPIWEISNE